ncbi:MAG: HlyD family efflux transporter periplasmic adaptor subunit [Planctomycetota bacterium]
MPDQPATERRDSSDAAQSGTDNGADNGAVAEGDSSRRSSQPRATDAGEAVPPTTPGPITNPRKRAGSPSTITRMITRGVVALVVLAVGVSGYRLMAGLRPPVPRADQAAEALVVRTLPVAERRVRRVWEGFGTARALRKTDVPAELTETVLERPSEIEAGAGVEAGQTLLVLDARDVRDRLSAAEQSVEALRASLSALEVEEVRLAEQVDLSRDEADTARRDLERTRDAVRAGAGTESEIDAREAAVRRAERTLASLSQQLELIPSRRAQTRAQLAAEQANAEQARRDVERSVIRAPFDGTLQSVTPRAGERVRTGDVVARLVDLSLIEVPLRVPVSAARSIRVGDQVELVRDGAGIDDAGWTGAVARIAPEADEASRTMTVFVLIEQDPAAAGEVGLLRPGQFVVGRVRSAPGEPGLLVPRSAVRGDRAFLLGEPVASEGGDGAGGARRSVRVVAVTPRHDHAERFDDLDPRESQWVVIEPGGELSPGDAVVLTNLDQLIQGAVVRAAGGSETRARSEDAP